MSEHSSPVPVLEPVWFVEAPYVENAAEARVPFRPAHLARVQELKEQGVVIEAGAFADSSASILIVRAEDEEAALELCREDVYWQKGIWVDLKARAFGRVP